MISKLMAFLVIMLGIASCKSSPEPRFPKSSNSGSFMTESAERNKTLAKKEHKQITEIIENNSSKSYLNSSNGFWYTYINKNETSNTVPKFGDKVVLEYDILSLEGDTIYSKEEIGVITYYIDQERMITGIRQGVKLMKEEETVQFLFPSFKAFGFYGDLDRIGSDKPIISNVTLKSIEVKSKLNENE